MKKLLLILILLFSFQLGAKADDIKDFEIEGMSIGDSLLDFMNKSEVKNNTINYFNDERTYYVVGILDQLELYDQVELYLKTNDKKYEIKTISGMLIINDLNKCLSKKAAIVKDIDKLFSNIVKQTDIKSHEADLSGNSKQYIDQYTLDKMNHVRVECVQWSQKMKDETGYENTLNVVSMSDEVHTWIMNGYK